MQGYLGWEELYDDRSAGVDGASDPIDGWEALEGLMKERSRIEQQLMKLLGKAPPDPADAREAARFPLPIHTAESRMADRRAAREEERARAAARRSLERLRVQEREEQERVARKRDAEAAALAAEAQRQADARREAERRQDRMRALLVDALIRSVWDEQRAAALDASQEAKRKEWSDFAEKSTRNHDRARDRLSRQRADDRKVAARLDSRPRKRPVEDPLDRPRRTERNAS